MPICICRTARDRGQADACTATVLRPIASVGLPGYTAAVADMTSYAVLPTDMRIQLNDIGPSHSLGLRFDSLSLWFPEATGTYRAGVV